MNNPEILKRFSYKTRKFLISLEKSLETGDESITLSEEIIVREKPLKHVIKSDGVLNKTDPIMFACRNDNGEIEVSMQYEGFPLEPLLRFIEILRQKW